MPFTLVNYYRKILLLTVLFLSNLQGTARVYNFLRFTTNDGLAGNNVYFVEQDKDGFIWIATETGVSRFDGSSFKNYTVRDGLPSNDVNWIFVDSKNRIWMSPFKGEICYFYQGRVHNKHNDDLLKKIVIGYEQKSIAEDSAGNLLLYSSTAYGYIKASGKGQLISAKNVGRSPKKDTAGNWFFYSPVALNYVTTNDSCQVYLSLVKMRFFKPQRQVGYLPMEILDTTFKKYTSFYLNGRMYGLSSLLGPGIGACVEVNVMGERSFVIFQNGTRNIIKQPADIISAAEGIPVLPSIVLNAQDGCYIFNIESKKITDTLLTGMAVNMSYIDRDSGIWVGTNGNGLLYFPSNRSFNISRPISKMPVCAYHFYARKDSIWVGSNNAQLWQLDQGNQVLKPVKWTGMDLDFVYPQEGNVLRKPELSILKTLSQKIRGIVLYNSASLKSLMVTGDTVIGVYPNHISRLASLKSTTIDSIIIDSRLTCAYYRKGFYYAGTLYGLYILPTTTGFYSLKSLKPIIKGTINSIAYSYRNGLFWVTTLEDGVYCLDGNTHRIVKHFNEQNGLSSPICTGIFTDGTKAYVGTTNGLNIIDPSKDFSINCYYTLDGLPSNFINCIFASGNKVWVGTTDGISCIDIGQPRHRSFFKLNLTQVLVSGKELAVDTNDISLSPQDNNIRFDYSGVTFASMGKVQYRYRLKGLDDVWQTTDQRYLQYPSLPSGTYTFELYAIDRFRTHSNRIKFTFTIAKEWWEYRWIQAMGLLLLLGLAGTILWWRIARMQRREQEKIELRKKIIELEQLALRAQMNPHFIFNSLNSFYQYVIDKDLEGASKFMSDFSHLIRLLFETTSLYEIPLDKEIDFLSTYLELERTKFGNTFSYHIIVQPDILTEEMIIPSFIIQPFIENSIWHGIQNRKDAQGKITLSIATDAEFLIITIDDNGVGRAYTEDLKKRTMDIHNSRGIALTEERIELYNKTHDSLVNFEITDKYKNGASTGTQVVLKFPLKNIA